MLEDKLIIIPTLGNQNKGKSSFTGSGLLVFMSQCGKNNELALQHGGFCTTWSLVAKGLLNIFVSMFSIKATVQWFKIYKIPAGSNKNEFAFNGEAKNKVRNISWFFLFFAFNFNIFWCYKNVTILVFIIHEIFSLACDWSRRVTWANIPRIFPNF